MTAEHSKKELPKEVPLILAPVGGREQFFAALKSGADAVYLGLKNFNARARAENFDLNDMRELIPLANHYNMQVLITLNILVKEDELEQVIRDIHELHDLGVHAFIIQDPGVIKLVRELAPHIRIHASTQMAIHNCDGVLKVAQMGVKRIVLARETTLHEMKQIYAATRDYDLELEAFCHGSLCYSYSGLCFFSGAKDARSGNRGECAYTCRHPYKIISEPGHGFLFSMKDLNSIDELEDLVCAGVHTLKIEGRKKDAMYVSTAVRMYRQKLNEIYGRETLRATAPEEAARPFRDEEELLWPSLSFQRKPTNFFLSGRYRENAIDLDNPTHLGTKAGKIKTVNNAVVMFTTKVRLEKYDGLRIDTTERLHHSKVKHGMELTGSQNGLKNKFDNNESNFSLRQMKVNGKNAPVAEIGDKVELSLPRDIEVPHVGDFIYQTRSSELKAEISKQITPPSGSRLRPLQPVDAEFECSCEANIFSVTAQLVTQGKVITSSRIELPAEQAKNPDGLKNSIKKQFAVLGQSGFCVNNVSVSGDSSYFVPASLVKELKRNMENGLKEAYEQTINGLVTESKKRFCDSTKSSLSAVAKDKQSLVIKFDRIADVDVFEQFATDNPDCAISEFIFEPKRAHLSTSSTEKVVERLEQLAQNVGASLRFSLPMVIRSWDEPFVNKWLDFLLARGHRNFEVGNPGALTLLDRQPQRSELSLSGDFTMYTMNSLAADVWHSEGISTLALSVEDDLQNMTSQMKHHANKEITYQAIVYKDTPLFIAEACSLTALHDGCPGPSTCGYRTLVIENDNGERFHVAHENCKSIVYGEEAYSLSGTVGKLREIGINQFRVDFLTRPYTPKRICEILTSVHNDEKIYGTNNANFFGSLK